MVQWAAAVGAKSCLREQTFGIYLTQRYLFMSYASSCSSPTNAAVGCGRSVVSGTTAAADSMICDMMCLRSLPMSGGCWDILAIAWHWKYCRPVRRCSSMASVVLPTPAGPTMEMTLRLLFSTSSSPAAKTSHLSSFLLGPPMPTRWVLPLQLGCGGNSASASSSWCVATVRTEAPPPSTSRSCSIQARFSSGISAAPRGARPSSRTSLVQPASSLRCTSRSLILESTWSGPSTADTTSWRSAATMVRSSFSRKARPRRAPASAVMRPSAAASEPDRSSEIFPGRGSISSSTSFISSFAAAAVSLASACSLSRWRSRARARSQARASAISLYICSPCGSDRSLRISSSSSTSCLGREIWEEFVADISHKHVSHKLRSISKIYNLKLLPLRAGVAVVLFLRFLLLIKITAKRVWRMYCRGRTAVISILFS